MSNRYKCHAKNVVKVLRALAQKLEDGDLDKKHVAPLVEDLCNELQSYDSFGTEGQCDPRGDQRD